MKLQPRRDILWVFVFIAAFGTRSHAADVTKANNTTALNLDASWSTAVPTSSEVAVWDSTVTTANAVNLGANLSWSGIRIADPGGAVTINNTANTLTLGSGGIDLSAATQNLTIGTSLVIGADQTWNLNAGRTLNLWTVNTGRGLFGSNSITLSRTGTGTGTIVMLPGPSGSTGFADANSNSGFSGNWTVGAGVVVQNIRNGATAWGTGTINLNGGQIAQIQGSWTWTNGIALGTGTASSIANSSGTIAGGRYLKLQGVISGSGDLTFLDTTGAMNNVDTGFIITGINTMNGTVTIPASRFVRVGGVTGNDATMGAGSGGTLGTTTVTNNGTLTLSRSDTWTFANVVSGTGVLRIGGGVSGANTQAVTMTGVNKYTGTTTVNTGTLAVTGTGQLYATGGFFGANNTTYLTVATGATLEVDRYGYNSTGSLSELRENYYAVVINGGRLRVTGTNTNVLRAFQIGTGGATLEVPLGATFSKAAGTIAAQNIIRNDGTGSLTLDGGGIGSIADVLGTQAGYGTWGPSAGINKTGPGTWTLSGANTYTGATNVSGGTLLVNGNQSSAIGAVGVSNAGTTLGGLGTIGGTITVNSGAILRGDSGTGTGPLNTKVVNVLSGGGLLANLGPSGTNSSLTVTGTLDFATGGTNPKVSLVGVGFDPNVNGSWILATTTGGVTVGGSAPGLAFASYSPNAGATGPVMIDVTALGAPLGGDSTFTLDQSGNNLVLNYTPVPEPAAVLGLAALALAIRRRTQRARS